MPRPHMKARLTPSAGAGCSCCAGAPEDGTAWTAGDCERRVVRGGSWGSGDRLILQSAIRFRRLAGYRDLTYGFRVARTL